MTTSRPERPVRNWAGNVRFGASRVVRPRSLDELREVVASSQQVRALGTGHSFSTIADTAGVLIVLDGLPPVVDVDVGARTATVDGWVRWGELATQVQAHGLALHNMGSLPHISVAGSLATGTHGSGSRLGCLATAATALELVTADGEVRVLHRGDDGFDGAVVALGALGVVVRIELELVPTYDIEQTVWENVPFVVALDHFDHLMDCARSVSLFTSWAGPQFEQVWVKRDTVDPPAELGWTTARVASSARHPVPGQPAQACTDQGGVVGPWQDRMPHFRIDATPSSGKELQSEYLVDRTHVRDALLALRDVSAAIAPVVQVGEIRTVAGDSLWLSPCHDRPSVGLHFTWVDDIDRVRIAVQTVERALAPFDARPHWGKLFTPDAAQLRTMYPRLDDFVALRERWDPQRRFDNAFLRAVLTEASRY